MFDNKAPLPNSLTPESLIAFFEQRNYVRVEPPILQPAHIFTELSGEDIRKRLFITQDSSGNELCLRPEFTIPVAREHLKAHPPLPDNSSIAYCYYGPVFRLRHDESGEFSQAGTELINRHDKPAADAECLAHVLESLACFNIMPSSIIMGDMALLHAVLDALNLSAAGKRRVLGCIVSGKSLDCLERQEIHLEHEHAGLLSAIEGQEPHAVKAFVEDILSIAGIARVGGRSAGEIAERFLAKASNRSVLSSEQKEILERYLAISGEPDDTVETIRTFAKETQLDVTAALADLETRIGFMATFNVNLEPFRFDASFARNLDYYTGFIFEIYCSHHPKPIAGGGRYDHLFQHLGANETIPAVGGAFWLDRLLKDFHS